ncbi:MAG: M10 family metallopeptidase C-terminal domain-containing protein, partial [Chloroflexi bacterium]|nr:M10 family metallopeptidase C-terminal domain-containing protein [Chloroflexota bacterium]
SVTANLTFDFDATGVSITGGANTATHFGSAFETFIGGGGNDLFDIDHGVSVVGYIDGQGGDNTLNLGAFTTPRTVLLTGLGAQSGFDGVDPAIPNGFKNISIVTGSSSSSTDRFAGLNEISDWDIGGTNTYTTLGRTLQFSGFEKLTGGAAADTFTLSGNQSHTIWAGAGDDTLIFNDGAILTGSFDGQSDHDTVNMAAYASARQAVITGSGGIDGFDGSINGISGVFTNVNNLLGSTNSTDDSITGGNFDAFWDINAQTGNQYSAIEPLTLTGNETDYDAKKAVVQGRTVLINNDAPVTLDFAGFEILQGNDQNDIFEFTAAQTHSVLGGADVDYFVFNDGAALTGTIDGQTGRDTLDYNAGSDGANTSNLNFVLTGFSAIDGFVGQISSLQFSNLDEIIGGAAIDTLTGLEPNSTWMVNDYPTFSRYVSTRELTFAKLDTLIGGSGIDIFDFADNATLAGKVEGKAGDDTLDFSDYSSVRNFTLLSTGTADGFDGTVNGIAAGFADINTITGGTALDTLTGRNYEGHWAINSADSGIYTSDNSLTFTKVDTLIGGSAADRFDFAQGASIAGLIDGGDGTDLLDYVDFTTSVTVDLSAGLATGVNGNNPSGASNVENISGGSADDSLTGDVGPNEITGNEGNDALAGLGGDDTFFFVEGWGNDTLNEADSIDNDIVDFSTVGVDLDITLGSLHVTDNVSGVCGVDVNCLTHTGKGVDTFIAGTGNDTFHINASLDIDLQGSAGVEEFIFADNAVVTGTVDGGADTDTLNFSAYSSGWDISLTSTGSIDGFNSTANGATSVNNIDIIVVGSGVDKLTGLNTDAAWRVTGTDTGQYTNGNSLAFGAFENWVGGDANDTLTFAALSSARDISLLDVGTADGFDLTEAHFSGVFKNMNTLVGSTSADDKLAGLDAVSAWQLIPGGWQYESTNTLKFSAIENLVGGSNSDTLNYAAYTTPVDITLIDATAGGFNGIGTDLSSFSNMDVIIGGQGDDTLTGADQNATWDVDALAGNQYTLNPTLDFTSFETLIGGSGDDTFNIVGTRAENLEGGSGDDCFIFADGAVITTTIHGGIGSDTLDYSGYFTDVTVNLATGDLGGGVGTVTDIENITGGHGDDTLTGDDGDNILTGGPGRDLMAGGSGDDIYRFFNGWDNDYPVIENPNDGNDTFDLSAITNSLTFILGSVTVTDGTSSAQHTGTHIENLIGGFSDDTFQFNNGAALSGMIDGRTGVDRLDLSAYTSALTTRLTGLGSIDGVAGTIDTVLSSFDNINALTTGSGNDTLIGLDTDATWIINPNPTDNVYASGGISLDFYGVENLTGGSATDTFKLVGTATVTGNVNGGLGAGDTLDYSTYATAVVVDFPAGTATGVGGTVSGVETVVSNGIGVTLEGDEHDNLLIGGPGDDIILGYGGNDTLIGNGGNDLLDGGEGNDTVDYSGSANGVEVDLSAGTATDKTPGTAIGIDTLISIENVIGSDFADTLTGSDVDNILTGGSGDDTLAGLGGDDTYRFGNNADTDIINELAAGGVDTFDFSAATVDLTFSISSVLVTGASINITHTEAHIENLIGGSGDDTFGLGDGASLAGYIDGRNGIDEINFSAYTSARFVVLTSVSDLDGFKGTEDNLADGFRNVDKLVGSGANTDALTGLDAASIWTVDGSSSGYSSNGHALSFSDFEILNGGVDADIFNVLNAESGTLSGNAGDDTLHIAEGATLTGSFDGGSGADTISFSGGTAGRDITLTGLGTTDGFAGNAAAGTFDNVNILIGGNGSDSLAGLASGDWQINGANTTYTSGNSLTFSAIERLIGGAGEDTFAFANGATL